MQLSRRLAKVCDLPFHMYQLAEPGDTLVQRPEMYTARVLDLPFIIIFVPRFTLSDHILDQKVSRRFAFSWEVCVYCLVSFRLSPLFSTPPLLCDSPPIIPSLRPRRRCAYPNWRHLRLHPSPVWSQIPFPSFTGGDKAESRRSRMSCQVLRRERERETAER